MPLKPKTYEEALAKKKEQDAKRLSKLAKKPRVPKPRKPIKKRTTGRTEPHKGKKKATKTTGKLKKELDAVFSKYIRAKYPAICYTCKATNKTLQCGHFVSRQYLATRWEELNAKPQCVGCNLFGNGMPLDFEENLKKELGEQVVEELKQRRHQILKLTPAWYEEEIQKYTELLITLQNS